MPTIIKGGAVVGSIYVLGKAKDNIKNQENSGIGEYLYEAAVGNARGMMTMAIFELLGSQSLIQTIGAGFTSGYQGSSFE